MARVHSLEELGDPEILRRIDDVCEPSQALAFRNLLTLDAAPANVPPVATGPLVVSAQIQRSGGTLVEHLFDHHPNCLTFPGELYLHPTSQTNWARFDLANFDARMTFADLLAARANQFQRYLRDGYSRYSDNASGSNRLPFVFMPSVHYGTFLDLIGEAKHPTQRAVIDAYLGSFFTAWLDYQRRYGEIRYVVAFLKRLNWPQEAELFFADYPDGFMITNVRRPDHWLASAMLHDPRSYPDAARGLELWCASTEATIAAQRRWPDRVFIVGFEDLVENTERVMAKLAALLGLEFCPTLLRPTFNGIPIESDSSFMPKFGIDRDVVARARREETDAARGRPLALYEEAMSLAL